MFTDVRLTRITGWEIFGIAVIFLLITSEGLSQWLRFGSDEWVLPLNLSVIGFSTILSIAKIFLPVTWPFSRIFE